MGLQAIRSVKAPPAGQLSTAGRRTPTQNFRRHIHAKYLIATRSTKTGSISKVQSGVSGNYLSKITVTLRDGRPPARGGKAGTDLAAARSLCDSLQNRLRAAGRSQVGKQVRVKAVKTNRMDTVKIIITGYSPHQRRP